LTDDLPTLVIGSRHLSSWSLRAWLALREAGLPFREMVIELDREGTSERIRAVNPAGTVPALLIGELVIGESLAIAELAAEHRPALWPSDHEARALARSVSAEMHAGFAVLRRRLPMDWLATRPAPDLEEPDLARDIARIRDLWRDCRHRYGAEGPYLFGGFGIADAMYAPVASRFRTYGVPLDETAAAYVEAVLDRESVRAWTRAAEADLGLLPPEPAEAAHAARAPGPEQVAERVAEPVVAPVRKEAAIKPIGAGTRRRRGDRSDA
jgi:glutathione S-transferase